MTDPTAPVEAPERVTLLVCAGCGEVVPESETYHGIRLDLKHDSPCNGAVAGVEYLRAQHAAPRELAVELAKELERVRWAGGVRSALLSESVDEALAKARSAGLLGEETGG